ncbi:hypothetical protein BUALT_Bualt16G0073000 [Buddleja alternifolia]|uniref:DDE Tnp4 domain-containing protein n=1 Tax=Buddleja alternifolia TaxID=168488 RepID=A0AAV6WAG4_9LAMI|nr:hypothetical protein BUALT_Bualt16G0073000 [Buddleja alternifolia]
MKEVAAAAASKKKEAVAVRRKKDAAAVVEGHLLSAAAVVEGHLLSASGVEEGRKGVLKLCTAIEENACFFSSVLAHHKKNATVKLDHVQLGHTECLGTLDGTYINVQTPLVDKPRYRNRKGGISVNILGVVDRNMNFVYMLLGWEGFAADGRVLWDAVNRANGLKVPTDELNV